MPDKTAELAGLITDAMNHTVSKKTREYDTTATVSRIETKEDGSKQTWVSIPGGVIETPVRAGVSLKPGDEVQVHVGGGRAFIQGNYTSPPTDDTRANQAYGVASNALDSAVVAKTAADSAVESAEIAKEAADEAKTSASEAKTDATTAKRSAAEAKTDAAVAKQAADKSLTQLSIIEDVAGTVDWISKHGSFNQTTDTTVHEGTVYFVYNSTTQDYEPIVDPDPEANPMQNGWYVLDISDSQTEYIMAHIAITGRGLWVLPSGMASGTTPASGETQDDSDARQGNGYKALLSNDGMRIYDSNGDLVSTFGESIIFSSDRAQKIGGDDNYIEFNPDNGSISIVGGDVRIGDTGKKVSEVVTEDDLNALSVSVNGGYTITMTSAFEEGEVDLDKGAFYGKVDEYAIYEAIQNPEAGTNPSEQGWYELVSGEYILTEDESVQSGKTYYSKTPNYGAYNFVYDSTYDRWDLTFTGEGSQWSINEVDLVDYGIVLEATPSDEDNILIVMADVVGSIENLNDRISDVSNTVEQNADTATNEINTATEELQSQINSVANDVSNLTSEVFYDIVESPDPSDNPSEKGWYEFNGTTYVLSQDTVVDETKTYYIKQIGSLADLQKKTSAIYFSTNNGFVIYDGQEDVTTGDGVKLQLKSNELNFVKGLLGDQGAIVASIAQEEGENSYRLFIQNASVQKQLAFGNYAFIRRSNGNMSLKWLG